MIVDVLFITNHSCDLDNFQSSNFELFFTNRLPSIPMDYREAVIEMKVEVTQPFNSTAQRAHYTAISFPPSIPPSLPLWIIFSLQNAAWASPLGTTLMWTVDSHLLLSTELRDKTPLHIIRALPLASIPGAQLVDSLNSPPSVKQIQLKNQYALSWT